MIRSTLFQHFSKYSCKVVYKHKTYKVGDTQSIFKKISAADVEEFAKISGDHNPIHSTSSQSKGIVHGAYINSLVSSVIGTRLPGPGTLVIQQTMNFPNKCFCDETVKVTVEIIEDRKIIKVHFCCIVEDKNKVVLEGYAKLIRNTLNIK